MRVIDASRILVAAVLAILPLVRGDQDAESRTPKVVSSIIDALARERDDPIDFGDETSTAWSYANHPTDTDAAILGVSVLWKKNRRALVELVWWRQKDPEVRKCVLLLYYSMAKAEASNFPDFKAYSERFHERETVERKREIDEVLKIVDSYRPVLRKSYGME